MTRALVLAVALLLAGCASVSASDCGASKGGNGLSAEGAYPLEILVLHDERPNRDVAFCARLDEHGALGKVMKGSNAVPNADWMAKGAYDAANVTIDAWIAGRDAHVNRTVDLARTPYVVLVLDGQGQLRIDAFETRPVFA